MTKIDRDSRSDLGQDTICALLSCKLNTEDSQLFSAFSSDELLKSAKSARPTLRMSELFLQRVVNCDGLF